jgi:hypothetical protein
MLMAFDEVVARQVALWNTLTTSSMQRWRDAANRARTSTYTVADLFEDARLQFVANWDAWNEIMDVPTEATLPSVSIRGPWNALQTVTGRARVRQRLTHATYYKTPLTRFGGGAQFANADYDVDDAGDFEGYVRVRLLANAASGPSLAAGDPPDIYRGIVSVSFAPSTNMVPLAWVVVVAEPV